jgi:hypothetical protein
MDKFADESKLSHAELCASFSSTATASVAESSGTRGRLPYNQGRENDGAFFS